MNEVYMQKNGMIEEIFEEIRAEHQRQNEKWDKQNHFMTAALSISVKENFLSKNPNLYDQQLHVYKKRYEMDEKGLCDILFEEVCKVFMETESKKQRKKMVQVAAVAVAIIKYLDEE